jgi:hypothetical protein
VIAQAKKKKEKKQRKGPMIIQVRFFLSSTCSLACALSRSLLLSFSFLFVHADGALPLAHPVFGWCFSFVLF